MRVIAVAAYSCLSILKSDKYQIIYLEKPHSIKPTNFVIEVFKFNLLVSKTILQEEYLIRNTPCTTLQIYSTHRAM